MVASLIPMILSMLTSQQSNGRTGMQNLNYFGEGGGAGGLLGGQGYAGKKTYGNTGKSAIANIFDPGGFIRPGGDKEEQPSLYDLMDDMLNFYRKQPEYIAYKKELDAMNPENNYGALTPDWGALLDRSIQKTQQVYRGSPTTTGIIDKIKADIAARNMSDSPALAKQMLSLGAQESQDIGDITTTMAEQERALSESARQQWLNRLQNLSNFGSTNSNLDQLFKLDEIQTPTQDNSTNYSALGGLLSGLFSGSKGNDNKVAYATNNNALNSGNNNFAGSTTYGQTGYSPAYSSNTTFSKWGY